MTAPFRTAALAHRAPLQGDAGLRLAEAPEAGLAILRGAAAQLGVAVRDVLDLELPVAVGETGAGDAARAMWLAPDEWLLETPDEIAADLFTRLRVALAGTHHQLVEVADQMAIIELGGACVPDLLAKLVAIDLHPRAFAPDTAVATVLGHAGIWLWQEGRDTFRLYTRRSFADYVWCLLAEAGREWGLPEQAPRGNVRLHLPYFEY